MNRKESESAVALSFSLYVHVDSRLQLQLFSGIWMARREIRCAQQKQIENFIFMNDIAGSQSRV